MVEKWLAQVKGKLDEAHALNQALVTHRLGHVLYGEILFDTVKAFLGHVKCPLPDGWGITCEYDWTVTRLPLDEEFFLWFEITPSPAEGGSDGRAMRYNVALGKFNAMDAAGKWRLKWIVYGGLRDLMAVEPEWFWLEVIRLMARFDY